MKPLPLHFIERPAASQAHGLLILLHGVGANPHSLEGLAREQDPSLHVILPYAPLNMGPGAYGWFQAQFGVNGPHIHPQQAEASRLALLDFIETQQQRLHLDPDQSLIAGFSQGGIMSASVGLTAPDRIASFAILSGRILPEIEAQIPANIGQRLNPVLIQHGLHDSKLTYRFAEQAQQQLERFQVPHQLLAYPVDHTISLAMRKDFRHWVQQRSSD